MVVAADTPDTPDTPDASEARESAEPRVSSFVLLARSRLPNAQLFRTRLEERLKGRLNIDALGSDGHAVLLLRIHGDTVTVGLIEAPLPKGTIQDLCEGAWYWRRACQDSDVHQAHAYVSVLGTDLDRLDAYLPC